jgi:hypothetical protein
MLGDSSFTRIWKRLTDLEKRLNELTPSIAKSFKPVTQTIVDTVIATVQDEYSTTDEMNAKIANPGAISPSSVSASGNIDSAGRVYSAGAFVSPGSRATIVTVGYVNAYLGGDGTLGYQPSTRKVKKDLVAFPDDLADRLLNLTPYLGRYTWDADTDPLKVFLIAEDVQDAGFGPDVVPLDQDGNAATVNSAQLVPALLALIKRQDARITALESASTS